MARLFLDTNFFIDLIEKRRAITSRDFQGHDLFISPLSVHILMYVAKQKIPYLALSELTQLFSLVVFDQAIVHKSLNGPTMDFEDNVQLHSAAIADCDLLLTHDKKLLGMKFFGKTQLSSTLSEI